MTEEEILRTLDREIDAYGQTFSLLSKALNRAPEDTRSVIQEAMTRVANLSTLRKTTREALLEALFDGP